MKGSFIGIGVGPGSPDLLTMRAVETLKTLDVLVVPAGKKEGKSEALAIVGDYLPSHVEIVSKHFPMISDVDQMMTAIKVIAEDITAMVLENKRVGFVTLGDPMLYSTYIYLLKCFDESVETVTIPGISSAFAIASGLNRPLAEGDTPLLIYPCTGDMGALETVLDTHDSIVLMKVYKSFEWVRDLLTQKGLLDCAVAVSNFGKPEQVIHERLDLVEAASISYFTTILINKRW